MAHPVTGIDHVFLLTPDLDGAAEGWRKLGFTVTPRGYHSEHMGSANHTIMLGEDYIELLGILRETEHNAGHRARLAGGEGLHAIACRIDDARAAVDALREMGIPTGPALDFERPVELPGGQTGSAAFSVAAFATEVVPRGHVFMCQHRSREHVWVREWMEHANGATALAAIVATADDPAPLAEGFARLFAAGRVTPVEGGLRVETGSAPILVLTPAGTAARYPGFDTAATPANGFAALELVADVDKARSALGAAGRPIPAGLAVAPHDATGTILAFVPSRP
jgi:catechol 2,3-dioxygenase-like lactoylglutathione lyase family enzyme